MSKSWKSQYLQRLCHWVPNPQNLRHSTSHWSACLRPWYQCTISGYFTLSWHHSVHTQQWSDNSKPRNAILQISTQIFTCVLSRNSRANDRNNMEETKFRHGFLKIMCCYGNMQPWLQEVIRLAKILRKSVLGTCEHALQ